MPSTAPIRNILMLAGRFRMRSGYLHMLDLVRGLARRDCVVTLVCDGLPSALPMRPLEVSSFSWAELSDGWFERNASGLSRLCRERKAQVIHVQGAGIGRRAERFLADCGLPVVFTPYSATVDCRQTMRLQRHAVRVIALSEFRREGLVNRCRIPREKLRVIRPGIDVESYPLAVPELGERVPVIGTVAPLEPGRGQAIFLEAAARLLVAGRVAEFVVAGDGPEERGLRALAERLGVRKHVTFVTGLPSYSAGIVALDIFVRPAVTGGVGYTVLEAMAMGKAVVATSTGDMPELVAEGRSGLMVPKGDPAALAELLAALLDDPERTRRLGLTARQSVAERFHLDRLVTNTLLLYEEAAG